MTSQAHPWLLDTAILQVTVRRTDGTEESRDIVVKAPAFQSNDIRGIEFTQIRLLPMWTTEADADTIASDPKTGEKRFIKKGTRISYEDKPLDVDTIKPHELVEYERNHSQ